VWGWRDPDVGGSRFRGTHHRTDECLPVEVDGAGPICPEPVSEGGPTLRQPTEIGFCGEGKRVSVLFARDLIRRCLQRPSCKAPPESVLTN
ncbi:hypothetical protein MGG_17176, partial [Pyricularia oryzae 70-15]